MRSIATTLATLALLAAIPTTGANVPVLTDHIVITEVMPNAVGANETGREWIELHNPTLADVDLSGWSLTDADPCGFPFTLIGKSVVPEGTILPAGGYLQVIFAPATRICLANGGDDVTLFDAVGNEIDAVWYGNGGDRGAEGATVAPPEGQSAARCNILAADGPNTDDGSPVTEFYLESAPTPGAANDHCLPLPTI